MFPLEICNVQCSITHVKPDHGIGAQVNAINRFSLDLLLLAKRKRSNYLANLKCTFVEIYSLNHINAISKNKCPGKVSCTICLAADAHYMPCFIAVLSIIHIDDKKRFLWLLSDNKKMFVQIQIKIKINRNISNECLILDIAPMHGIQFVCTV